MSSCRKAPARALPCAVSGAVFVSVALAQATPPATPPEIHLARGRLSVSAVNASLHDVLDRIAVETGMKVIYDGPPPQQRVSVSLVDETPAAVLGAMLENGGVPYAMGLDRSRTKVETLVIAPRKEAKARIDALPSPTPPALPSITDGVDLPENPPDTENPGEPEPEDSITP